ncbi:MAG: hypothetical protein Phyf2KO_24630 [Phycisphaerales bacterium]
MRDAAPLAAAIAALLAFSETATAQSTWINAAGGNWSDAANWDTPVAPFASGDSAIFPNLGMPYDVLCDFSLNIDSVTINGPDPRVLVDGGDSLRILTGAGIINEGTIVVNENASSTNAFLIIETAAGACALSGAGRVELNGTVDPSDAQLIINDGATLAINQPITGAGLLRTLNSGVANNNFAITADVSGSDLQIQGTINQNPTASLGGTGGGLLNLHSATVTGGRLVGGVEISDQVVLDGVTLSGTNGVRLSHDLIIAAGGITNNGTIDVNIGNTNFFASVETGAPTTIDGKGTIELTGEGSNMNHAVLRTTTGNPLTIESEQIVSGNGHLSGGLAPIIFRGIALGDIAGSDLTLSGTLDFDNIGRTQTAGGFVRLHNAVVSNAHFDGNTDTTGNSTLIQDCTNSSSLRVRGNSTLSVRDTLVNNGVITINHTGSFFNTTLRAVADTSLTGTGTVLFTAMGTNLNNARLDVDQGFTLDIGAGQTIEGGGVVNGLGEINMAGHYIANIPGVPLALSNNHDLTGGTAKGEGGGIITIFDADITGGTFNGNVEVAGVSTMRGFTNTSSFGVRSNVTLNLDSDITNNGTLTVNTTAEIFNARVNATNAVTINGTGTILLNGAGTPIDAQIGADNTTGFLTLPSTQTVIGNGWIDGPASIEGTLSPGLDDTVFGVIGMQDEISLAPTSVTQFDVFAINIYDRITLNSDFSLDGTIRMKLRSGYVPFVGDRFDIINAGTITGFYPMIDTPVIGGRLFRIIQNAGDVEALWTCIGDVNLDGALTPSDFTAWIAAYNSGDIEVGDQNLDGNLSPTDFTAWIANFNSGC